MRVDIARLHMLDTATCRALMRELDEPGGAGGPDRPDRPNRPDGPDWPAGALWRRLRACGEGRVVMSSLVNADLVSGLARHPLRAHFEQYARLREHVPVRPFPGDHAISERLGAIRQAQAQAQAQEPPGRRPTALDLLVATHAMLEDAVLVSDDRVLARIPDLRLDDWLSSPSAPPEPPGVLVAREDDGPYPARRLWARPHPSPRVLVPIAPIATAIELPRSAARLS